MNMNKKFFIAIALVVALLVGAGLGVWSSGLIGKAQADQSQVQISRPFIGVSLANITPQLAQRLGLSQNSGVVIVNVVPGSPAAQAGIQAKDILLKIGSASIGTVKTAQSTLAQSKAGDVVTLTILRGTQQMTINVTLAAAPSEPSESEGPNGLPGMGLSQILASLNLTGIQPGQLFDHFMGAQIQLTDKDSHAVTVKVIPGKVTSVSGATLVIAANDGSAKSFTVPDSALILMGRKTAKLSDLAAGDKVLVITINDQVKIVADTQGLTGLPQPLMGMMGGLRGLEGLRGSLPQVLSSLSLTGVQPGQLFDHFIGLQIQLTDKDGHALTVQVVPGKVASVSGSTLGLTANDGSAKSFTVPDSSLILMGRKTAKLSDLKVGDKVAVITVNDQVKAVVSGLHLPLKSTEKGLPGLGGLRGLLPKILSGLNLSGIQPGQLFGHLMGGQIQLTDKNGQPVTVLVIPGTVASISGSTLGVTANDGTTKSFTVPDSTTILMGRKTAKLSDLKVGDKVVVITVNDQVKVVSDVQGLSGLPGLFGNGMHKGMMQKPAGPRPEGNGKGLPRSHMPVGPRQNGNSGAMNE